MKWVCGIFVGVAIIVASVVTVQRSLSGEERPGHRSIMLARRQVPDPALMTPPADKAGDEPVVMMMVSITDALLRPLDLPFAEPTTLTDVQKYLTEQLGGAVVLDLAAMDRLDVAPDDTVQLDLKGVRLKTGLKLLLDQVGMTWRVVAEDNLLILTDAKEAGESIDQALRQLKALHDEMHDLQDAVDDLRDLVEEELGVEPESDPNTALFVRSPTSQRLPGRLAPDRIRQRTQSPARPVPDHARTSGGTAG